MGEMAGDYGLDAPIPQLLPPRAEGRRRLLSLRCRLEFLECCKEITVRKTNPPKEQEIYRRIGARLRERRIMLGLSMQQVAEHIGVTYQQEYKYEQAINRVPIPKLIAAAKLLNVSMAFFFEAAEINSFAEPVGRERMTLEIARNFAALPENHQNAVAAMVRGLVPTVH